MQSAFTTREILLRLKRGRLGIVNCIFLAIMVDTVEMENTKCTDMVDFFVFTTSALGLVTVAWLGHVGIYCYIVPSVLLCFLAYLITGPHCSTTSIRDETALAGKILAKDTTSLLRFYTLVRMRLELPDISTRIALVHKKLSHTTTDSEQILIRDIVVHALCYMEWGDLCILLSTEHALTFKKMLSYLHIQDVVEQSLETPLTKHQYRRLRRVALIISLVKCERYPTTLCSFIRRDWDLQITSTIE